MQTDEDRVVLRRTLETGLHIAVVALLLVYCFRVVQPFMQPVVWGAILAIALHPAYRRLRDLLGGRAGLSAAALVMLGLVLLIVPSVLITASFVESAAELAEQLKAGTIRVPPPPTSVSDWPLVGEELHSRWAMASQNLEQALLEAGPLVKAVAGWLVSTSAAAGMGILVFALSIAIAGVLLSYGERVSGVAYTIAKRLFQERGRTARRPEPQHRGERDPRHPGGRPDPGDPVRHRPCWSQRYQEPASGRCWSC